MSPVAVARRARLPEDVPAPLARHPTRKHEQMVREPVEIFERIGAEGGGRRHRGALRAPHHRPGEMELGKDAAGKNLKFDDYVDMRVLRELDKEGAFK